MSTSSSPTRSPSAASANASWHAIVDLPTPPLPESTSTLCFTSFSRCAISSRSGSSFRPSPAAHAFWFGQPSQPEAVPARSDDGPTHSSLAAEASMEELAASDIARRKFVPRGQKSRRGRR